MTNNSDDNIQHHKYMSSLGLVAHLTGIEIKGNIEENIVGVGRGRFVIIYIDDKEDWKSTKRSKSSPLCWQDDHRILFRPSTRIKIEVHRKSMISVMFPNKHHLIGRFSGRLIEVLGNDAGFDMTDGAGTRLEGIKITIKLTLISDSPGDLMGRVDAAISRLDDSVLFSQISKHIDMFAPVAKVGYSSTEAIYTCIPSLGQTFQAIVNIARIFGNIHPILKVSCTILFSVYEALKNEAVLSEAVRSLAESLRELVHSAHKSQNLLVIEGTENVIDAIGHVSMQIACLIDEYARLPLAVRSVRDALSDDMKSRVEFFQARCKDLREKFSSRMDLDTNQTIHRIDDGRIADRLQHVLECLKAPDPSRNHISAREKHQEGTGSWFFNGEEFAEWKKSAGSLLWVFGIPGCGKTILCSSAIEEVTVYCTNHALFAVAYFFFDSRDAQDDLQRHESLLRCLIKQLSLQCHWMPYDLEELLSSGHVLPRGSLHVALELLLARFKHAYVIVDSLDECTERSNLLGWLQRITHWEGFQRNLHILVTSRDELDIRQCLTSLHAVHVCLRGRSVNDDIRSYIDHTLRTNLRMKRWNNASKEEVRENVLELSGGMFRLAALQLEELQNCFNLRELRRRLAELPRSLYETYDRILSKVNEEYRQTVLRLLQWLAFSARLPRLDELAEVLAVDFENKPHPRICHDLLCGSEDVLILCSNLIIVSAEGNVQLAHLSVKEYLLNSTFLQNLGFTINERLSHSLIAQTCLAYLLQFDTLEILTEETLPNFPLARYAAEHWVSHARFGASDSGTDPLESLTCSLFVGNDPPFISWVRLYDLDDPGSKPDMTRIPIGSRLYYACLAGMQDIALAILDSGADSNAKGLDNVTVLQVASRDGQYRAVQHLLEKGAEVNMKGGWFGPALKLASARGHEEIVRLLLENGADINMQSREFNNDSALQAASYRGHEKVVRLLLEKGARVNAIGGVYGSALQAAAVEGHESIVRLLVDNGAEVDIRGGLYGTALHDASEHGQSKIVRFLLESGATVDMPGGRYSTALQAAAQAGHKEIVTLLLEYGADMGKLGGRFGSVLQAAASGGEKSIRQRAMRVPGQEARHGGAALLDKSHTDIVRLLLERGAQVNVPLGGYHGGALQGASLEGHKESVKLLLEKGAEVNAENEKYSTALHAAALEGHEEIVKLLLENAAEVDTQMEPWGSALQAAASSGNESIVRLLLEKGADVNKRSQEYGDALQAASIGGHGHIVGLLLENGADVNARGIGRYKSALQAASKRRHQAIVELLLEKGAVG